MNRVTVFPPPKTEVNLGSGGREKESGEGFLTRNNFKLKEGRF